ncbi:OmpA family protein [Pseudomonas asplenii]|uniref:Outer membrane protein OmpA n=1 Tax=Pseudomonas asplenii TaxID=53407 RepID=A0A1H6NPQ1_9PSED|nr:OmpA family protein [Pseudomonas fuscovaginae]SEI18062.1 Outer membrane protein OmpA [Pseudomonas fuscovaginae]
MTLNQTWALWLWASALVLVLAVILPLTDGVRGMVALFVVVVLVLVWRRDRRHGVVLRESLGLAVDSDNALPTAAYRQPIVLVCGDGLPGLFGDAPPSAMALRTVEQGCYIRVAGLQRLPMMIAHLMALWPTWRSQLCVMFVCNPGEHRDEAVLAAQVRAFGNQLVLARRRGAALPLMVVSYLQATDGEGPWFSWEAAERCPQVHDASACSSLDDWQRQPVDFITRARRAQASVQLNSVVAWLSEVVQPRITAGQGRYDVGPPAVCGVTLVPALSARQDGNLWQQWLRERVALLDTRSALPVTEGVLPFPDPLLPLLSAHTRETPVHRVSVTAVWLFALAAVVALVSSTWQNNLLVRQVSGDLHRYLSIAQSGPSHPQSLVMFGEAMMRLRQDAQRLDSYYRHGAPFALGLGLYRGEQLRAPLLGLIADHRPPAATPVVREPVSLDSLSLFSSGSARLKPESAKVLINALVGIKAQSGWLIVIGGHTDATGEAAQNLHLSRARAAAVRDWIQSMGDIPDSCLAVQGFGDSQPIASNDTEAGRTLNRRVEIRLVPAQGACALPGEVSNRQSTVSSLDIHHPQEGASHGNSDLPMAAR